MPDGDECGQVFQSDVSSCLIQYNFGRSLMQQKIHGLNWAMIHLRIRMGCVKNLDTDDRGLNFLRFWIANFMGSPDVSRHVWKRSFGLNRDQLG